LKGLFTDSWSRFQIEYNQTFDTYSKGLQAAHAQAEAEKLRIKREAEELKALEAERRRREAEERVRREREALESAQRERARIEAARRTEMLAQRDQNGPLPDEKPCCIYKLKNKIEFYYSNYGETQPFQPNVGWGDLNVVNGKIIGIRGEFNPGNIWRQFKAVIREV